VNFLIIFIWLDQLIFDVIIFYYCDWYYYLIEFLFPIILYIYFDNFHKAYDFLHKNLFEKNKLGTKLYLLKNSTLLNDSFVKRYLL
jgi:hypothetical protein